MTLRTKQILFPLLVAVLASILLLSASLSGLKLQAGTPIPGSSDNQSTNQGASFLPQTESTVLPLLEAIFAIILLILMIYVAVKFIGLVNLRSVVGVLVTAVLLLLLIIIVPRILPGVPTIQSDQASIPTSRPSFDYPLSPLGEPPPAFAWLAAGGILIGIGLLAIQFLRRKPHPMNAANTLLQDAEQALDALREGKEFSNVIIRCYLQMAEVLRAERSLEREDSMTAGEFQDWLELQGMPTGPVQQLTSLFEKARYSQEQIDRADEETGAQCLEQIVVYLRKA